jgi:hypothetical protein
MGVNICLYVRPADMVKIQFTVFLSNHLSHLLVQIDPIWTFTGKKLEAIAITVDERILF